MSIDKGIIALLALATVGQIASAIFVPSMPVIAEDLAVAPARVQSLSSIYLLVYALAHLLGGFFCDRLGRRRIIASGIIVAVIGGLITIMGTLNALYVGRILQALGFGLAAIATKAILRDRYSGRAYAVAISYFLNAALLAPAFAPLIGAWLTAYFGWLAQFIAVASTTVVMAIGVYWFYNKDICEPPKSNEGFLAGLLPVVRDRRCIGLSLVSGIVYASDIAIELIMPFFLKDKYGAGPAASALFFAMALICILMGSSAIRYIKRDIETVIKYGTVVMLGASFMLLVSNSALLIMVALGFYLLACGMLYSTLSALALLPHKRSAGIAASISGAIHMGVAGLGSSCATWFDPALATLRTLILIVALSVLLFSIALVKAAPHKFNEAEGL